MSLEYTRKTYNVPARNRPSHQLCIAARRKEAKMEFPNKIEDVTLDQADELLRAQAAYCRELSLCAANFCYVRAIYSEHEGRHEEAQEFYKRAANQANIAGDAEMERLYRSKIVSHDR